MAVDTLERLKKEVRTATESVRQYEQEQAKAQARVDDISDQLRALDIDPDGDIEAQITQLQDDAALLLSSVEDWLTNAGSVV